jgi:hypothetical protein
MPECAPIASASKDRVALPWPVYLVLAYLAAITVIGKGPTYLGVPPVFWGEIVMVCATGWALLRARGLEVAFEKAGILTVAVLGFVSIGAVRATASVNGSLVDIARDSAVWYYAAFYFIGVAFASDTAIGERTWRILCTFWMIAVIWHTVNLSTGDMLTGLSPIVPGRGTAILENSGSEAAEHLFLGMPGRKYGIPDRERPGSQTGSRGECSGDD